MRLVVSPLALIGLLGALVLRGAAAQLTTPRDWRWVLDRPAALVTGDQVPDSAWRFVAMPPGWHVTTGPGAVLYHPAHEARGRFSVEAEIFLFPDSKDAEYGVFVGGAGLEGPAPRYTAFVLRRDGAAAVLERRADDTRPVVPWSRHDSVAAARPGATARNLLRIDVDSARFVFTVNGARIAEVPRGDLPARGRFGFRVGAGVNLHASTLDYIVHLAPLRARPGG